MSDHKSIGIYEKVFLEEKPITNKSTIDRKQIFRKGPFSKSEQNLVDKALVKVLEEEGIPYNFIQGRRVLSFTRKELPRNFWKRVALSVPSRTVESIYDHVRRRLSSKNYRGKWTEQEISKLKGLIEIYGQKWTKIGFSMNRLPGACYDKWRDALKNGEQRQKGKWTQEERCKLIQLVTIQLGHEFIQEFKVEKAIKWTFIAENIGSRSYLQCRNEWARFFSPGSNIKLTIFDSFKLIQSIFWSEITDETEIKWSQLVPGIPAHKTYNKWRSLCKKFLKEKEIGINLKTAVLVIKNSILEIISKEKSIRENFEINYRENALLPYT